MTGDTERTRVGHCKRDETDVYAGRGPGGASMLNVDPSERGWLGNPYSVDEFGREESIYMFRMQFEHRLKRDHEFREAVADLAGKTLGCWCQRLDEDGPACHAEIIAEWASSIDRKDAADTYQEDDDGDD